MKKLILPFIILIGFTACHKQDTLPKYIEKVLYSGDSVRYNFDSLPAPIPVSPVDYSDYHKLVQVYTNNTLVIDFTHIQGKGISVTYRGFVRYKNGDTDFKGWYRRRVSNSYIIPANKKIVIYRSIPYNSSTDNTELGELTD